MKKTCFLLLCACASNTDNYCENIGDCAQGGSFAWVQACESNLGVARDEALQTGCGTRFDAFYSCASSSFVCSGNTPTFPGCDSAWSALNACVATADQQPDSGFTWCAQLAALETSGGCGATLDAGSVQESCSVTRDCEAQCFVTSVSNVCSPDVIGLDAYTQCAASCPATPLGDASAE